MGPGFRRDDGLEAFCCTMKIYGDMISGNCLKVKYTADYLGLPYDWIPVDVVRGECRAEAFLAMNPMGQVPVIGLDDGRHLAQSNAIVRHLARGSDLIPDGEFAQAKADELMFWEQYSHEPYVAVCRFQMRYQGRPKEAREEFRVTRGEAALDFMERQIDGRNWFIGDRMSIADIVLLPYTRFAEEGGFDLASRPNVRRWIARCEDIIGIK
jgi:glutathione S-transferase